MIRNGFITTQEARRALDQPLALTGGDSLGPLSGVSLAPEPPFSGPQLAIGVLLLGVGILALIRKRFGSVMRLLPPVIVVIGALMVARSLRAS